VFAAPPRTTEAPGPGLPAWVAVCDSEPDGAGFMMAAGWSAAWRAGAGPARPKPARLLNGRENDEDVLALRRLRLGVCPGLRRPPPIAKGGFGRRPALRKVHAESRPRERALKWSIMV
jgi:hypothetical protein